MSSLVFGDLSWSSEGKLNRVPAESQPLAREQGLSDCILSSHVLEHGSPSGTQIEKSVPGSLVSSSSPSCGGGEYSRRPVLFIYSDCLPPPCWKGRGGSTWTSLLEKRSLQYWQEERGFKSIHLRSESLRRSIWLDRIEGTNASSIFQLAAES